ncbi:serine hydrolase domain-containing protein [Pedobacter sp. JY14-1]|uniref:serine hydrolase domain-containing protein n=1 Tax=Pedobacter sp. JY14-1 TaxID=3034151 RepID=UPI0023E0FCAB|nr:serine hydrolase domain-containing protein [Pedobacter sp. JY14-1]
MRLLKLALVACFLWINFSLYGQTVQRLDSLFTTLDTAKHFNGNILVAQGDRVVYRRSVGFAQIDTHKTNTLGSAFQIGSVSKTFTSLAILQLVEKGRLSLDDSVQRFLPDFPFLTLTIRHLLSHTSGLPDKEELFFPKIDADTALRVSNQDIVPALIKWNRPLAFAPGSQWRYNNIGFALLALVVEKVSGEPFAIYLARHIFAPAGMKDSYLLGSRQNDPNRVSGYLVRHHYLGDLQNIELSGKVRRWSYNMRGLYGPTNIVSTTPDLLKFVLALDKHRLLGKKLLDEAFTPYRLTDGNPAMPDGEFGPAAYGLGWFLPVSGLGKIVMHTGREPGFFTFFCHDLKSGKTLILLDNAESTGFGDACKQTFNIIYGTEFFPPEPPRPQSLFLPYVRILLKDGADAAATFFNMHKADTAHYFTDERELNELGLELLSDRHNQAALETLKLCTLLFPQSWNTYDSYGKALLQSGRREDAIDMYRKSVEMFPENLPGKKILEELIAGK